MSPREANKLYNAGLINRETHEICQNARTFESTVGMHATKHAMDAFANSSEYHRYHRNRQQFMERERENRRIDSTIRTPIDIDNNYQNKILKNYSDTNIEKISQTVKETLTYIDWNDSDMRESSKNGYHKNLYNASDKNSIYTFGDQEKCYSSDKYLVDGCEYELLSKREYMDNGEKKINWNYSVNGIHISSNTMAEEEIIKKMGSFLIQRTKIGITKANEISHGLILKSPENGQPWFVWGTRKVIEGDYILLVDSVNNCFDKFEINKFETENKEDVVLLLSPTGIAAIASRSKTADYFNFGGVTPDVDSLQPRGANFQLNDVNVYGLEILTNDELINAFTQEKLIVVSTGGGIHSNLYGISTNGSRIQSVKYDYFNQYRLITQNQSQLS